ncbi:restriction endonuclease subunit S [Staphylococcus aureus]|uniref:restriction endonuclease subunit S n=1 Tax=Staphylococcus aureus TaxID=1280 RepID=UPI001F00A766|nr:restriction endonuclease subunit S [Staphylococcus aureus]
MKPDLRFPEFKKNWSFKKLKDLLEVYSGRDYKHLEPGEIPVYGTGGYMLSVSDYLSNNDAIGIGRKGTINKPYLLKAPFWTVDTLFYCIPRKEVDLYFLLSLFKKINWKKYDESTGVPSLSKVNIEKIKVYSCELEEQEKIGNFFSKLDRQIELEEEKLELLEQQKRGYLQKIFSQELRFKDENNSYPEWKIKKLEEISEFQNGKAHENFVSDTGKFILVNSKFISTESKVKKYVDKQLTPLEINDIAIVMSDVPNGKALAKCYLIENDNTFTLNQRIGRIFNIEGNSRFLFAQINRNKQLLKYDNGVGQTNLKKSEIIGIKIYWPNKREQDKIGDFFINLDSIIEKQSSKVEILKQRKLGFLQKMFV